MYAVQSVLPTMAAHIPSTAGLSAAYDRTHFVRYSRARLCAGLSQLTEACGVRAFCRLPDVHLRSVTDYCCLDEQNCALQAGSRLCPRRMCGELGFNWQQTRVLGNLVTKHWYHLAANLGVAMEQQLGVLASEWREHSAECI